MTRTPRTFSLVLTALLLLLTGTHTRAQFAEAPVQTAPGGFNPSGGFTGGRFGSGGFTPNNQNAPAEAPAPKPSRNVVYLGSKRIAVLGKLRQTTLNAHVTQYEFAPKKPVAAVVGSQIINGRTVPALWLVNASTGETRLVPVPSVPRTGKTPPVPFVLHGWDGSGRYLLVSQDTALAVPVEKVITYESRLFRVDINAVPVMAKRLPTPGAILDVSPDSPGVLWSPSRRCALVPNVEPTKPGVRRSRPVFVFSAATGQGRLLMLPPLYNSLNWQDDAHLHLSGGSTDTDYPLSFDIRTRKATPTSVPPFVTPTPGGAACPVVSHMTVIIEGDAVGGMADNVHAGVTALWLDREHSPFLLGRALVGLSPNESDPRVTWTADGRWVGFIAYGDLFLRHVSYRAASLEERDAAGDALTDSEQETLAAQMAQRIGAALLRDIREADIYYPPAEDVGVIVVTSFPPGATLTVSGHPFVYHAPPPSTTPQSPGMKEWVLGEIALARVTVTLYGDGRVVSVSRPVPAAP